MRRLSLPLVSLALIAVTGTGRSGDPPVREPSFEIAISILEGAPLVSPEDIKCLAKARHIVREGKVAALNTVDREYGKLRFWTHYGSALRPSYLVEVVPKQADRNKIQIKVTLYYTMVHTLTGAEEELVVGRQERVYTVNPGAVRRVRIGPPNARLWAEISARPAPV